MLIHSILPCFREDVRQDRCVKSNKNTLSPVGTFPDRESINNNHFTNRIDFLNLFISIKYLLNPTLISYYLRLNILLNRQFTVII